MILASANEILSNNFIGKYSINACEIKYGLIPYMYQLSACDNLIIFDEIGRMQNTDKNFLGAVDYIMGLNIPIISTVVHDDEVWSRSYKDNNKYFVITITENNREYISELIISMIGSYSIYNSLPNTLKSKTICMFNNYINSCRFEDLKRLFERAGF